MRLAKFLKKNKQLLNLKELNTPSLTCICLNDKTSSH